MIYLAFAATLINYLDRQTLSVVAPVLREQFQMSNIAYSQVLFAFLLAYTVMNGVSGTIIDRLGTRAGYALCIAWWSLAAVLHVFTQGPLTLGLFRFLLGMGEAGNWPAAVRVVVEWFPKQERALASGLFNAGSAAGAILAPPLIAYILLQFGWRATFLLSGTLGFIWLCFWWPIYHAPDQTAAAEGNPPASVWSLLRTRFVWSFMLSKVFMDPAWYFYTFWFAEYLKEARHFDMASIGKFGWIPFLVAGLGNIFGGWLSAFLLKRGVSVTIARKSTITFFAVVMMAAIPAVLVSSVWLSIVFISIAMAGYTGGLANMLVLPGDVFPKNVVGSVYGLASMGAGFGGMLFTLLTGWVVDQYSYTPVFIGFGLIPLVGAAILWTMMGPLQDKTKPHFL